MRKFTKAFAYISILLLCVGCETEMFYFSNLRSAVMEEGDSLLVHLQGMYSLENHTTSNDSICKVVPTNKKGTEITIYALCPGLDTVDIIGISGISAHAPGHRLYIKVIEKDTTKY